MVPRDPADALAFGRMIALTTGSLEKFVAMMNKLTRRPKDKVWKPCADQCRSQVLGGLAEAETRVNDRVIEGGRLGPHYSIAHHTNATSMVLTMAEL